MMQRVCWRLSLLIALASAGLLLVCPLLFDPGMHEPARESKACLVLLWGGLLAVLAGLLFVVCGLRRPGHPVVLTLGVWLLFQLILPLLREQELAAAIRAGLPAIAATAVGLVIALCLAPRQAQRLLVWAWLGAVAAAGYTLLQVAGVDWLPWYQPGPDETAIGSTLGNRNYAGAYAAVFAAGVLPFVRPAGKRQGVRAVAGLSFVLFTLTVIVTLSRGAVLGWLAGVLVVVVGWSLRAGSWRQRVVRGGLAGTGIVLGGLLLAVISAAVFNTAVLARWQEGVRLQSPSFANRVLLWRVAVDLWREAPWTGRGPGAYAACFGTALPQLVGQGANAPLRDVAQRMPSLVARRAHNDLLQMLAEQGLAGTLGFALVVGAVLVCLLQGGGASTWRLALLAAMVCLLALAQWSFPLQRPATLLLFYALAGCVAVFTQPFAPVNAQPVLRCGAALVAVALGCVLLLYGGRELIANRWYQQGYRQLITVLHPPASGAGKEAEQAEASFRTCLRLSPAQGRAQFQLGNLFFSLHNDYATAVRWYEAARTTYNRPRLQENLAECRFRQGRYAAAATYWQTRLLLRGAEPGSALKLGQLAYVQGEFATAVRWLQQALQWSSVQQAQLRGQCYLYLGLCYEYQGRTTEALTAYTRSLALAPQHVRANFRLGRLYAQTQSGDDALQRALYYLTEALQGAQALDDRQLQYEIRLLRRDVVRRLGKDTGTDD